MRPWASRKRCGLNNCRYSSSHGRPRLPRSRRTPSTVSAFCITRASRLLNIQSPGPLRPVDGLPVLPDEALLSVGWAARRGPGEPGPFPGSLPPNPACGFHRTGLSSDLCRVRDRVRVDVLVARRADDEGLAPHSCHERCPRGLARPGFPEVFERGDLVDCHRGTVLAQLAPPPAEPVDQLLARGGDR